MGFDQVSSSYLFGGRMVGLVVEPAEPFGWHHTAVIVHTVLRVVHNPPVAQVKFLSSFHTSKCYKA